MALFASYTVHIAEKKWKEGMVVVEEKWSEGKDYVDEFAFWKEGVFSYLQLQLPKFSKAPTTVVEVAILEAAIKSVKAATATRVARRREADAEKAAQVANKANQEVGMMLKNQANTCFKEAEEAEKRLHSEEEGFHKLPLLRRAQGWRRLAPYIAAVNKTYVAAEKAKAELFEHWTQEVDRRDREVQQALDEVKSAEERVKATKAAADKARAEAKAVKEEFDIKK